MKVSIIPLSILVGSAMAQIGCIPGRNARTALDLPKECDPLRLEYLNSVIQIHDTALDNTGCCDRTPCFIGCYVKGIWQVSFYYLFNRASNCQQYANIFGNTSTVVNIALELVLVGASEARLGVEHG